MSQILFIVGARGAGKTTVGKIVASTWDYHFCDTDVLIQQTAQRSVAEIVAQEGWAGFRQRESAALQQISQPATVVATGGGMILAAENRTFMYTNGVVFYLRTSSQVLAQRLSADPEDLQRPTLTGKPMLEEIEEVLQSRERFYQQCAHYVLDGSQPPQQVANQIITLLAAKKK